MVEIYETEAEQIEYLKKLWREYGVAIIIGVIAALVLGLALHFFQGRKEHTLEHASMRYEQLLTNVVNGNTDAVSNQANRLMARYGTTPYASFAALQLARQNVYENKYSDAESQLRWVMQNAKSSDLREIARVRLARVLLAENQPQQVLNLLAKTDNPAFAAAEWEAKGDALLALNKSADARMAYQAALKAFPGFEVMQPILQMKVENLAGANNAGAQG